MICTFSSLDWGDYTVFIRKASLVVLPIVMMIAAVGPVISCSASVAGELNETEREYNLYFGDLHSHTDYSDGTATPDIAYTEAQSRGADFLGITDDYFQLTAAEWEDILRAADDHTEDGAFIAIPGYEYYLSGINEINIYGTDELAPYPGLAPNAKYQGERMTGGSYIPWIYDWISETSGAIGQWNHPLSYGCPVCWDYYQFDYCNEDRDAGMGMLECYNWGYRDSSYVKALDAGWHMMPTATEDDHYGDWISPLGIRTVLLAPSLTRENLYEAMREGRGYATLDSNLEIYFTLDGGVMGSNLSAPDGTYKALIDIHDEDGLEDEITRVEIVTDGGVVVANITTSGCDVQLDIDLVDADARYFFVRVTTASPLNELGVEGVTAWTAPVWTGN